MVGFLQWVDLTGVLFNAMIGAVIGRAAKLDVVGLVVLAIMSGLGGGMIRDVLLQSGPPIAITDWRYLTTALVGCLVVTVVRVEGRVWERIWPPIDALAVGTWAAAGALKTLGAGFGVLPALMLGTITAVGGGFTRDVVLRRVPAVLGGNTLYASIGVLGSVEALVLFHLGHPQAGMAASIITCAVLGLLARRLGWMLPEPIDFRLSDLRLRPLSPKRSVQRLRDRIARREAADVDPDDTDA